MKPIFYLVALFLITNAATCKRITLPNTKWKVLEMRLPNTTSTQMPTKDYILEFKADSSITIKLDVNNCFSKYKLTGKNEITIHTLGCTKVCCDSEFAQSLANTLPKMQTFKIKGDNLILEGDGNIKLELIP